MGCINSYCTFDYICCKMIHCCCNLIFILWEHNGGRLLVLHEDLAFCKGSAIRLLIDGGTNKAKTNSVIFLYEVRCTGVVHDVSKEGKTISLTVSGDLIGGK